MDIYRVTFGRPLVKTIVVPSHTGEDGVREYCAKHYPGRKIVRIERVDDGK